MSDIPRDRSLGEYHRLIQATEEVEALLRAGEVPLSRLQAVADRHQVQATVLLRHVEMMAGCGVDLAAGVLRCRPSR